MPLRGKVVGFLRQFSSGDRNHDASPVTNCTSPTGSFIQRYLNGELKRTHPDVLFGKSCYDLPAKDIAKLSTKVIATCTGPKGGLMQVNKKERAFSSSDPDVDFIDEDYCSSDTTATSDENEGVDETDFIKESSLSQNLRERRKLQPLTFSSPTQEIAGITDWNRPAEYAHGVATTLYECHPVTGENVGEPVADAFAVCARENSAILALADGVNWGERSCIAARSAVHGCIDYLNKALYREENKIQTTMDIFVCLLRSFHAAHNLILQENGMLTTLCAAVICQLKDSDQFVVCTCNVGDSLAYVFSPKYGVWEITQGSHNIHAMRDMRDALGALGPVDGLNPELGNLTVAMTIIEPGDIVFLTSDGVSDNFDPVVGKFALPKKASRNHIKSDSERKSQACDNHVKNHVTNGNHESLDSFLPVVEAHQRHELGLLRMEDLLFNGFCQRDGPCSNAKQLCEEMIDFAMKLTVAKRRILEDPELYKDDEPKDLTQMEQRLKRKRVGERLSMVPGKLDHASIVAYTANLVNNLTSAKKRYGNSLEIIEPQSPLDPVSPNYESSL